MVCSLRLVDNAFRGVAYLLRFKHEVFYFLTVFNRGRHCLFSPPVNSGLPKYYVLFKKSFFLSFSDLFPEFSVVGESINEEFLDLAVLSGVDYLLFVYDDGKVYSVSPLAVKRFCEQYNLIRFQDKTSRVVKGGVRVSIREKTYSFPVTLLDRFGDIK